MITDIVMMLFESVGDMPIAAMVVYLTLVWMYIVIMKLVVRPYED